MTDLLGRRHLLDQVQILDAAASTEERSLVEALVEISASLYAAEHSGPDPATQTDLDLITMVLACLESISGPLASRFDGMVVHMGDHGASSLQSSPNPETWKPTGKLWTAPVVEPTSAWALWAESTGNARSWTHQVRYESPPRARRIVLESLAAADAFIDSNPIEEMWTQEWSGGVQRIDFSWRTVLEAECSVLCGSRPQHAFPAGLGTECSVWVNNPSTEGHIFSVDNDRQHRRHAPPSNWFNYE